MLRTFIHYGIFLGLLLCLLLFLLARVSRSQSPMGLLDGELMNCPDRPICVSSQQNEDHPSWVEALHFAQSPDKAWKQAQTCVQQIGGQIEKVEKGYLWATFSSSIFGFVDDLELYLEVSKKEIQVRSASRIGYYDMGVNRKRVNSLRACFQGPQEAENTQSRPASEPS